MKRTRYNWKARQKSLPVEKKSEKTFHVELDESLLDGGCTNTSDYPLDSNLPVLPCKKAKVDEGSGEHAAKRKKLNAKQRKRLLKVVEAKQKKAKHVELLDSLSSLSLPASHISLLEPSISLGKARKTQKQVLQDAQLQSMLKSSKSRGNGTNTFSSLSDISGLIGTTWGTGRKNRKRRQLKAEKLLLNPKPVCALGDSAADSEEEDEMDDDSGDGDDGGECIVPDGNKTEGEEGLKHCEPEEAESGKLLATKGGDDCEGPKLYGHVKPSPPRMTVPSSAGKGASERCPAQYIQLVRDPDIQCARLALPILSEEQAVMEAINEHPVVVLCGETGSGKTTQVPQFLYEAGYTLKGQGQQDGDDRRSLIGVTEPRRVAAVSMSRRVGQEMGLHGNQVSYQIRYEGNTSDDTVIKFMTDGVLLKEVEKDFLLSRYSVVVLDEAHERSVFTDILIGLLSRIVPLREKNGNPLKLVIMSATLRVEDFTENRILFPIPPPVVKVESRQYPVTIHFNRRTPDDYAEEALRKVCKIHTTLQPGNILVFVTGQQEVHSLCRALRGRFGRGQGGGGGASDVPESEVIGEEGEGEVDGWSEEEEEEEEEEGGGAGESAGPHMPLKVLPLYSLLSSAQQAKVFVAPPEGVRLCVVATNVAETSLTIPNIKYVVDTGKVKRRYYDKVTGISTFRVTWTSKASANQRAGRAGRTEPGHCYRLFSSAVFHNDFETFSPPEVTRRPVDDLVLQMKAMNIDRVTNFPFPTPPPVAALNAAESLLLKLGALEAPNDFRDFSSRNATPLLVTPLGRTMAQFPLSPRYAKMLALGRQHECLPYVIALVAALSVKELFVETGGGEEGGAKARDRWTKLRRSWAGKGESLLLGDLMVLLRVVGACEYAGCTEDFCLRNGVRRKAMLEIRKLRKQLTNIVNSIHPEEPVVLDPKMAPLSQEQAKYMRQIVLSGLGDHVARKITTQGLEPQEKKRLRYAYQSMLCTEPVYMHSSTVLLHETPDFVVFQEITETSKLYMRGVSTIEASWLPRIQPDYCTFSAPLEDPPPFFDATAGSVVCHMACTYGDCSWSVGAHEMPYPNSLLKYKLFAMFLLQGKVIPAFDRFSPFLLVAPISLLKKWSKLHKQCEVLVAALANKEVCTRDRLLSVWKEDPKYLLKAYSLWLPESKHKELTSEWPLACTHHS